MKIERDVSLASKTTFKIGGIAKQYVEVATLEELRAAFAYAHMGSLPVFMLGGGSNILISDAGFSGLVIKNNIKGISWKEFPKTVDCVASAGENWDDVVSQAVQKGLQGIENLSLVPGSVGGAIVQNIGAYGSEIKDVVQWVDVLDTRTGQIERVGLKDCQFEYRNSFFKSPAAKHFIVVSATLRLEREGKPKLVYKDLIDYFAKRNISTPTVAQVRDAVVDIRTSKLPDFSKVGTAGSFFKNQIITKGEYEVLKKKYPEIPFFEVDEEHVKVPLAWIIDKVCNLKGYKQGNVGIYEKQAVVLVNYGNATQKDIDLLAGYVARSVFEKTGLTIEREVESVLG